MFPIIANSCDVGLANLLLAMDTSLNKRCDGCVIHLFSLFYRYINFFNHQNFGRNWGHHRNESILVIDFCMRSNSCWGFRYISDSFQIIMSFPTVILPRSSLFIRLPFATPQQFHLHNYVHWYIEPCHGRFVILSILHPFRLLYVAQHTSHDRRTIQHIY